jgi:hypothetical protein
MMDDEDGSDVHLRSPKKRRLLATCFFYYIYIDIYLFFIDFFCHVFGRSVVLTRGNQKHDPKKTKKTIWAHHKKRGFFFLRPPGIFFSLGCFARFFYRVFGRFVTRRVQKRDKKSALFFRSRQKKYLLAVRHFFFKRPPLVPLPFFPGRQGRGTYHKRGAARGGMCRHHATYRYNLYDTPTCSVLHLTLIYPISDIRYPC